MMGKKAKVVPEPTSKEPVDLYAQRLDALMLPWESEGWAIQSASKRKLADRKARIVELRRKIAVAGTMKP